MKDQLNFEQDLSIDKFKLDQECLSHPSLYYRYSDMLAEAKHDVGLKADNLKLVMGEANISIRNNFIKREIKFTEAVIASEVESNADVLSARDALRKSELILSKLQAGVSAFEHRKSQLDNLVKLYVAGYFSTPAGAAKPKAEQNERASQEMRSGLNGKRRSYRDE